MSKINVGRWVLGGLVAGVLAFIFDGIVHGVLLKESWQHVMTALGRQINEQDRGGFGYYAVYDLVKGFAGVFLYISMRTLFGPGPKTAILAGLLLWALVIPLPLGGLIPAEFFGRRFAAAWSLYALIPTVIFTLVGAWLYQPPTAAPETSEPALKKAA